jgi:hypothetical protein
MPERSGCFYQGALRDSPFCLGAAATIHTDLGCPETQMAGWKSERARLAAHRRHHPDDDPTELRQNLNAAVIEARVQRLLETAPPLSAAQRDRLAAILRGAAA